VPASDRRASLRRPSLAKLGRRWLYLTHRWVGIASCLFFAMWFVSGLVMIYVPYPSLSPAETLARGEAIDWRGVDVSPPLDRGRLPREVLLEMRDGVPVWRAEEWDGARRVIPAHGGAMLPAVDRAYVGRVARRFGGVPVVGIERIVRDQWTVSGGFDRHRPLWKATLADNAGTELYVSSSTGGVVQSTTRRERFWNWLGSVPHWLYPTILRQDNAAWRQVVMWVSGPCIAAAVAGMWIGILRTRIGKRRFRGGRVSPYKGWMLWHHVAGLVGGGFLIAWIFSGWLSVDPGHLFRSAPPDDAAVRAYAASDAMPILRLERLRVVGAGAVRARLTDHAGMPLVTLEYADGHRRIVDAATLAPARVATRAIVAAAGRLQAGAPLLALDRLNAPDAYWYGVDAPPLLPVLRLRFDDPGATWLYIDPATGEVLATLDRRRRAYRWAFDLLHKWDLNVLTRHRPVWDLLLWLFSIVGLVTSVSGIWLGWKRLRR
jgi:uncharacterized iron-regulated membrane protein